MIERFFLTVVLAILSQNSPTPQEFLTAPQPLGAVDASGVFWMDPTPRPYRVCVPSLPVYGRPGGEGKVYWVLEEGEIVKVRERSQGIVGWVMIEPARWVLFISLCDL